MNVFIFKPLQLPITSKVKVEMQSCGSMLWGSHDHVIGCQVFKLVLQNIYSCIYGPCLQVLFLVTLIISIDLKQLETLLTVKYVTRVKCKWCFATRVVLEWAANVAVLIYVWIIPDFSPWTKHIQPNVGGMKPVAIDVIQRTD